MSVCMKCFDPTFRLICAWKWTSSSWTIEIVNRALTLWVCKLFASACSLETPWISSHHSTGIPHADALSSLSVPQIEVEKKLKKWGFSEQAYAAVAISIRKGKGWKRNDQLHVDRKCGKLLMLIFVDDVARGVRFEFFWVNLYTPFRLALAI